MRSHQERLTSPASLWASPSARGCLDRSPGNPLCSLGWHRAGCDATATASPAASCSAASPEPGLLDAPAWPGADRTLGDELLAPSVIYAPTVLALFSKCDARGAAHITGGGLAANVARMLGPAADAVVRRGTWPVPTIFSHIASTGPVMGSEMERVFNLGIGMVVAVPPSQADAGVATAHAAGHEAWVIGEVGPGSGTAHLVDPDT